jgi:hypothetical protein
MREKEEALRKNALDAKDNAEAKIIVIGAAWFIRDCVSF